MGFSLLFDVERKGNIYNPTFPVFLWMHPFIGICSRNAQVGWYMSSSTARLVNVSQYKCNKNLIEELKHIKYTTKTISSGRKKNRTRTEQEQQQQQRQR
jgi:hypothetical protein